jgi:hypothetical protein
MRWATIWAGRRVGSSGECSTPVPLPPPPNLEMRSPREAAQPFFSPHLCTLLIQYGNRFRFAAAALDMALRKISDFPEERSPFTSKRTAAGSTQSQSAGLSMI